MRYTASFQTCHGSNPLRAKSGSFSGKGNRRIRLLTEARKSAPCQLSVSGNLQGERYLSCHGASAVRRRVVEDWTIGRGFVALLHKSRATFFRVEIGSVWVFAYVVSWWLRLIDDFEHEKRMQECDRGRLVSQAANRSIAPED